MPPNNDHFGSIVSTHDSGINIIDCEQCGFKHISPLPTSEELNAFYEKEFYQDNRPLYINHAEEDEAWYAVTFGGRLDRFEEILDKRPEYSVLDIGSGPGMFLEVAQNRGWHALGIEPSRLASEYSQGRGHNVINALFDKTCVSQIPGKFDVVHMNNVLEHIENPRQLLEDAKSTLKSDGMLSVTVPNDFNMFQQAITQGSDRREWWVSPKHHLNYFDFDSLEKLLQQAGYKCVERDTDFPMELFLLMGEDYTSNPSLGRQLHKKRKHFDTQLSESAFKEIRHKFYKALADIGLGRNATIYAKLI